jgi:hypothetical protein
LPDLEKKLSIHNEIDKILLADAHHSHTPSRQNSSSSPRHATAHSGSGGGKLHTQATKRRPHRRGSSNAHMISLDEDDELEELEDAKKRNAIVPHGVLMDQRFRSMRTKRIVEEKGAGRRRMLNDTKKSSMGQDSSMLLVVPTRGHTRKIIDTEEEWY